jgi:hypothetical protein
MMATMRKGKYTRVEEEVEVLISSHLNVVVLLM